MIPPVADDLLAEAGMELIKRAGELPGSILPSLFFRRSLIEQGHLFSIGRQPGYTDRHLPQSNPSCEASLEERPEHRRYVMFPTALRCDPLTLRHFDLIAVSNQQGEHATDPPLTTESTTEPLQGIQ
jgi:hypothetical protein